MAHISMADIVMVEWPGTEGAVDVEGAGDRVPELPRGRAVPPDLFLATFSAHTGGERRGLDRIGGGASDRSRSDTSLGTFRSARVVGTGSAQVHDGRILVMAY